MNRQTIVVIVYPEVESWGNFKKLCEAKGWKYQTLANHKQVPKLGKPVTIKGHTIHRVIFQ